MTVKSLVQEHDGRFWAVPGRHVLNEPRYYPVVENDMFFVNFVHHLDQPSIDSLLQSVGCESFPGGMDWVNSILIGYTLIT